MITKGSQQIQTDRPFHRGYPYLDTNIPAPSNPSIETHPSIGRGGGQFGAISALSHEHACISHEAPGLLVLSRESAGVLGLN